MSDLCVRCNQLEKKPFEEYCDFCYGEKFEQMLNKFILACLKEHSKKGSMTKTELINWFKGNIERVDINAKESKQYSEL